MKPLCIYHGNCADGFTAAWAVRKALGEDVDFHPGIYGQPAPDVAGRDVVMVDFSYKRPVLESMAESASSILILDHHKTAAEDLERSFVSACTRHAERSGGGRCHRAQAPQGHCRTGRRRSVGW